MKGNLIAATFGAFVAGTYLGYTNMISKPSRNVKRELFVSKDDFEQWLKREYNPFVPWYHEDRLELIKETLAFNLYYDQIYKVNILDQEGDIVSSITHPLIYRNGEHGGATEFYTVDELRQLLRNKDATLYQLSHKKILCDFVKGELDKDYVDAEVVYRRGIYSRYLAPIYNFLNSTAQSKQSL